jgi:hypothetical protein
MTTATAPRDAASANTEAAIWVDDDPWDEHDIPPRPWIAPGYALRGSVTLAIGPPSAMKSSLFIAWSCALALGRAHGDFRPVRAGSSILYNVEDVADEQRRRLSAALRQFGAVPADVRGRIIRAGPVGVGTLFVRDRQTGIVASTPAMEELRALIAARRPDILFADPLVELHVDDENDNGALRAIIAAFRAIAVEYDIAVVLAHHIRKGAATPGDPDAARGAGAIVGACRVAVTLCPMSVEDAEALGLPTDRPTRSRYLRLDDARQSYAGLGNPRWYEKVLYRLDNGEMVSAMVPWQPPDPWEAITPAQANRILDDIEAGLEDGRRYSDAAAAGERAAWVVVRQRAPTLSEAQARAVIRTWIRNGLLFVKTYRDPTSRKDRLGLYVDATKRPGPRP